MDLMISPSSTTKVGFPALQADQKAKNVAEADSSPCREKVLPGEAEPLDSKVVDSAAAKYWAKIRKTNMDNLLLAAEARRNSVEGQSSQGQALQMRGIGQAATEDCDDSDDEAGDEDRDRFAPMKSTFAHAGTLDPEDQEGAKDERKRRLSKFIKPDAMFSKLGEAAGLEAPDAERLAALAREHKDKDRKRGVSLDRKSVG